MRDSASRVGMNSTNFDLSFTASNISFTAGPLLSLSSPTINTREALDVADYLLSGVSPSPSPAFAQQPIKPNPIPDEDGDDGIDPNQENIHFLFCFIVFVLLFFFCSFVFVLLFSFSSL